MEWAAKNTLRVAQEFQPDGDIRFYDEGVHPPSRVLVRENEFTIFFPSDAHKPSCNPEDAAIAYRKVLSKVEAEHCFSRVKLLLAFTMKLTCNHSQQNKILTAEAQKFLELLHREFNPRRMELLKARHERQAKIDAGEELDFLPETRDVRESAWQVAPAPADFNDRRVEITGPIDRKMIINALNSGAKVFMADCEDATSPTWANMVEGQINLRDAVRRNIRLENADGRVYELNENTATLVVRPRGWHLHEKHVEVDGAPMSGSLFDFGLYFFHNARELLARGSGPYFYLPKLAALPGSTTVERCIYFCTTTTQHSARLDSRHSAH